MLIGSWLLPVGLVLINSHGNVLFFVVSGGIFSTFSSTKFNTNHFTRESTNNISSANSRPNTYDCEWLPLFLYFLVGGWKQEAEMSAIYSSMLCVLSVCVKSREYSSLSSYHSSEMKRYTYHCSCVLLENC